MMNCGQCGAPLPRQDTRFCTRCGAPVGQAAPGQQGGGPPYGQPGQPPYGQPEQGPYGQPQYGQPSYGPPPGPQPRSSTPIGPILVGAALLLVILGGIAYWALSTMDNPPISVGRATTPTPVPTPTVVPTATQRPGLSISIPGPQGTPTPLPISIPGLGSGGTPGVPSLPIPGLGAGSGTPPPNAKLTADDARAKVKESLGQCRVLHAEIDLAQVTFEAPVWHVRLPLTGATWNVDDNTGAVTPDQRAAERARTCR